MALWGESLVQSSNTRGNLNLNTGKVTVSNPTPLSDVEFEGPASSVRTLLDGRGRQTCSSVAS
jgi:hypothetical protein